MTNGGTSALAPEELARAHCYALLSRLFYAAPDDALLSRLAAMRDGDGPAGDTTPDDPARGSEYASALEALRQAATAAHSTALKQEYDDYFVGAGKAPVTAYTSAYALPHSPDRHLLALRERLGEWGLARRDSVFEAEDHASAVCDVMRWLIEHERPIDEQSAFFGEFVYGPLGSFCSAIKRAMPASFYAHLAEFTRAFLEIEKEAFDLHAAE